MSGGGLIFGGMLNGLGQGAALYGASQIRDANREDELRLAAEERRATMREQESYRAERAAADRESREDIAGAKGGAASGTSKAWWTPGTPEFSEHAAQMQMSEPALAKLIRSQKSGSRAEYDEVAPGIGPNEDGTNLQEVRQRSSVADKYLDAKVAALAELSKDRTQNKNRDDIAKGRATEASTARVEGMINGAIDPSKVGPAMAAEKGEGAYGKGGVNQFTGKADDVGKSSINENNAQAGSASASGKRQLAEIDKINDEIKNGKTPKGQTADRLTTIVNSQNATLRDLANNRPTSSAKPEEKAAHAAAVATATEIRDKANAQLRSNLDDRAAGTPSATKPASGKVATSPPIASLPAGAKQVGTSGGKPVYKTPDGKKFIKD